LLDRLLPGDGEIAARMRAFDWAASALGAPEEWPEHLRVAVRLCLTSRFPTLLWWGADLLLIYNDAFLPWLGESKHPRALMRPGRESWSEIWDTLGPMLEGVVATGKAIWSEEMELYFDRKLRKEEVYMTFTYAPILAADGKRVEGILNPATDVTEKVIGARRLETLRRLGIRSALARTVDAACKEAAAVLGENNRDIPFVAIYVTDQAPSGARLSASVLPAGDHRLPASVTAAGSQWPLLEVLQTRRAAEHDLLAAGVRIPAGPWPEPTEKVVVVPIPAVQNQVSGLLVAGVSPRRPLDAAYRTFFDLVAAHVGTAVADAGAYEIERKRAEILAELDRAKTDFLSNANRELSAEPAHPRQRENGKREKIIWADDDVDMREFVRRLLADRWDVVAVENGSAALTAAREEETDLVLADVMMPVLDGFGLVRELRGDPRTATIPIILLSARAGEESRLEGLRQGADDYLVKPFSARELIARVESRLELSRVRREALSREQELRERLQLPFEHMPIGCIMFHPQLKTITDWNPAAEKIFGYQRSEVLGRNGFEVLLEPGSHVREDQIVELLRKGEMAYSINRNVTKDGRSILCEWHNTPLRDAAGEVIAVMSMVQDVTERKQVQAERERLLESERLARTEAERATHIKDEFLATVSHELRSPLTAIVGWADVIRHGKATQGQIEHGVEVIRRNALTQAQLIGDLLDLSRIVTGKMRLTPEVVDLAAVIHAAVELVKPSADARTIEISCSIEPLSERVHGDPARLQQIVGNLLSNAVKFTPRGGRIELTLLRAEEHLEVRVSDTGEGIPADFLPHVFERFRQGDASAAREYGGLGIGLALVRELTQLHGGEVSAASDGEGKGATFTVKLPVAARQREPHPEASAAVPPGVIPGAARLEGVRVLLVDDEPDALEVIQRILEDRHAEVTPLRSADAALSLLAAGASFDVLLADIGMPGRDGYEFITDVRKLGIRTPAAALTALARSEDRTRALYTGFQAHLTKPAQASELLATVASLGNTRSRRIEGA